MVTSPQLRRRHDPGTTNLLINGTVRQDGRGQAAAFCLVYGTILRVDG
jgi:hypothetical protein